MTTLITGGTSSIGRVLIKQMAAQGEEVRVLVRPNSNRQGLDLPGVTFASGDVTDRQSVQNAMQGIQLAHTNGCPGDHYILGGEILTFPQIWAVIARILGKQPPARRIPLCLLNVAAQLARAITGSSPLTPEFFDMIAMDWAFRSNKAVRELGWKMTLFAEAMAATWRIYQAQLVHPVV